MTMTNKRLLTLSIIALIILSGFFVRFWLRQNRNLLLSTAISSDVPAFFEIDKGPSQWYSLRQDSIWSSLAQFEIIKQIDEQLILQDSLFSLSEQNKSWFQESKFFISIDKISAIDFGLIFYFDRRGMVSIDRQAWGSYLESPVLRRQYKGIDIFDIRLESGESFSFAQYRNLLIISMSDVLIERGIRQMTDRENLLGDDPAFAELKNKGDKNQDIKCYLNFKSFPDLLGIYLNEEGRQFTASFANFADRALVDITLDDRNIYLNGYVAHTSAQSVLGRMAESADAKANPADVLPVNTAVFFSKAIRFLDIAEDSASSSIGHIRDRYFRNWMGGSMAFAITEPFNESFEENCLILLSCADTVLARQQLSELATQQADVNDYIPEKFEHRSFWQLEHFEGLEKVLGLSSLLMHKPWFCMVDGFVIFANNIANLKVLINRYEAGKVLNHDLDYRAFKEHVSDAPIGNLYINTKRCDLLVKRFYNPDRAQASGDFATLLQSLNPIAIQFSAYTQNVKLAFALMQSSSGFQESNTLLWKSQLDTLMRGRPYFVLNHQNGQYEILVQDRMNQIYLIDRSGQILWKRDVGAPIVGSVYQVDFYHNRKLQMLFATQNDIQLIDRKGRDVENYPINLPSIITNGLSLIDYDGRQEYRMFAACANGKIYGFQISGSPLPGWNPLAGTGFVSQPLMHLVDGTKDYLYFFNKSGKLFLLNRRGEKRIDPVSLHTVFRQPFHEEMQEDRGFILSNIDTGGLMVSVNDKGMVSRDTFRAFAPPVTALAISADSELQWVAADEEGLHLFDASLSNSVNWNFPEDMSPALFFAMDDQPEAGVGFQNADSTAVYLSHNAQLAEGFPLRGITPFRMFDLFGDGNQVLIVGTADVTVSAYRIRK